LIQRVNITAPAGALLRTGSTMQVQESSFHGKLIVDGTVTGPSLDGLNIFGTLSGTGVISTGARLVGPDAQINPGGIGTTGLLTMGNLFVSTDPQNASAGRGGFVFELGPSSFDRLTFTRDLFLGGSLSISLLDGFTLGPNLSFPIIDVQGMLWDTFDGLGEGATVANFGGWDLHVSYAAGNGNDVVLYTVPEPSAAIYLAGLGAVLLGKRRRQR